MKSFTKLLGIIVLVAIMGVFAGCATQSSIGGTNDPHGFLISGARAASEDRTEIASYSVVLGLFSAGYSEYVAAVEAAIAQGKQISSVTRYYYFFFKTTAYAK